MKATVSFQAPAEVDDWLKREANRRLVSKSDVMREILIDHIRSQAQEESASSTPPPIPQEVAA